MKRIDEFRKYYNHTIHPELLRLERKRKRILRLLFFSAFLLLGILLFELYMDILILTLLLSIPIGSYIFYLGYRIRDFRLTFKPHIINLILDFIDDGMNFDPERPLVYDPKKKIDRSLFFDSQIFATNAEEYSGEDYIEGKVGEMVFQMSELSVKELSKIKSGYTSVFRGVFMHATFPEEATGHVIIWPRHLRQHLSRPIKNFHWKGGVNVDVEIMNTAFKQTFLTYATEETHLVSILSEPMQEAILRYHAQTNKDIYMSFQDREIYAAVSEEKDLLGPHLFRSNLNFAIIREFFEDILLLLRIAEDFDQTH
jgi:predicted nucleic acid-binding Zn ribbon protein